MNQMGDTDYYHFSILDSCQVTTSSFRHRAERRVLPARKLATACTRSHSAGAGVDKAAMIRNILPTHLPKIADED